MIARLIRYSTPAERETFGVLQIADKQADYHTAEPPWLDNKPGISCIPAGRYDVRIHESPHFGRCLKVLNVPGRDHILIHAGNIPAQDSRGCILLGIERGEINGKPAVLRSREALADLLGRLDSAGDAGFELEIINVVQESWEG